MLSDMSSDAIRDRNPMVSLREVLRPDFSLTRVKDSQQDNNVWQPHFKGKARPAELVGQGRENGGLSGTRLTILSQFLQRAQEMFLFKKKKKKVFLGVVVDNI